MPPRLILYVEDDPHLASALRDASDIFENVIIIVSTPEEALKLIEKGNRYDFIVTDGLNGRWRDVCEIGDNVLITSVVISARPDIVEQARREGRLAFQKTQNDQVWELFTSRGPIMPQ